MPREFAILLDGTRYDLNGRQGLYLFNPKGLGTENANQIANVNDNGFFQNVHSAVKSGTITGDLVIVGGYSQYKTFMDALMTAKAIVLKYKPNGTEYSCDVALNFVNKSEAGVRGALSVPISFAKMSPWYTTESILGSGAGVITAGGQIGTGIWITTSSILTNPTISLSDSDGTFALVSLNLTTTGGKLEYSNFWNDCHIRYNGEDVISLADISNPLFGHSSKQITIRCTGAQMNIMARKYWRTV